MVGMGMVRGIAGWLGLTPPAATHRAGMPDGIRPAERTVWARPMTTRRSIAVPAVFRGLQVLTTAVGQLSVDSYRHGRVITGPVPSVVRNPSADLNRSEWLKQLVIDLVTDGNAFVRRDIVAGELVDLPILPAAQVTITRDQNGKLWHHYQGHKYSAAEVEHLTLLKPAGWLRGMGPIEAARRGLSFAEAAAEYAAGWFDTTGQPTGVLTSDQNLTSEQARQHRNTWNNLDDDGKPVADKANPSGIKVLGKGLEYSPTLLKPADALWLEAQEFTTTEVARLLGMPASLMLIAMEGNSSTYANVSQEWLGFVRFTVMAYLKPIEDLLTTISPHGQTVRFNLEGLLRADTKTRYEAHTLALAADTGWMTVDEVRDIEGLPPLDDAQRSVLLDRAARLAALNRPTPELEHA